jgi:hypothetical protein
VVGLEDYDCLAVCWDPVLDLKLTTFSYGDIGHVDDVAIEELS